MASKVVKHKLFASDKQKWLFCIIAFFALALTLCVKVTLAYYEESTPLSILASSIGDFDRGNGNVNMMIYKETGLGTNVFVRSASVPALGYRFNDSLTTCMMPCSDGDTTHDCKVKCDETGSCAYEYQQETKTFNMTSEHELTCKFYFNLTHESDISVSIMVEDELGDTLYNNKTYLLKDNIPAYGYRYVGYRCDKPVKYVDYEPETKKFIIETESKNNCNAYFEKYGSNDFAVNVYVQSDLESSEYVLTDTIPKNHEYTLNSSKSACSIPNSKITYVDGYIDIEASGKQTCNVYLDLVK